ncbi:hypothetical protein [Streptomyces sp. SID10815]|uniref:hypothetical protein n=1 Tax=Streptomyces sp. SID10815 TaxID=2706027 RepID=UPI0013CDD04E|nr:hypothetical protein [Streptomyces sp. SID10815]NEA48457.1 hypothetical protein [Streptomyces sp. SID10815]
MYVASLTAQSHAFASQELADAVAAQWDADHPSELEAIEQLRAEGLHRIANSKATCVEVWPAEKWDGLGPGGWKAVWTRMPDRRVVHQGLAAYNPDGTISHEFKSSDPIWEFETDSYTVKDAEWHVTRRPNGMTEAWARGCVKGAFDEAYLQARQEAIRVCAVNR